MISQEIKMLQIAQREVFRALDSGDIDEAKKLLKPMFKLYNETLEMLNKAGGEANDNESEEDMVIRCAKDSLNKGRDLGVNGGNGQTALHIAAGKSFIKLANFLLDNGVDINAKDNDGRTPIFFAFAVGSLEIIELFIERGADLNIKDRNSCSLSDIAMARGCVSMILLLEEKMQEQAK
jgi:ankyrin repeat protein